MRISSSHKDYYDCGQSLGQDLTLVYCRYPKTENLTSVQTILFNEYNNAPNYYAIEDLINMYTAAIGFCGQIVPMIMFNDLTKPIRRGPYNSPICKYQQHYCYTVDDLEKALQLSYPKVYKIYLDNRRYRTHLGSQLPFARNGFDLFFKHITPTDKYRHFFEDNRCPVFAVEFARRSGEPHTITYHAQLSKYGFYRYMEPFKTFQEIAMWLGNQAEPRKKIPEIPDEILLRSKGFDEYSFRKEKSKK